MSEKAEGEVVSISGQQLSADGKVLMDVAVNLYGFENTEANAVTVGMIRAIIDKSVDFGDAKSKGVKPSEMQAKNPGAIR